MRPSVGDEFSHYRILEPLGHGGQGVVYKALDTQLGREVAIKTFERSGPAPVAVLKRLQREARRLASFQHPHIVTVFAVEEFEGTVFIAMELLRGGTLRSEMQKGLPTPQRWLAVGLALSEALAAAHEQRVIHRDLKPENVLLDGEGRPKLADFGLALLGPRSVVGSSTPTLEEALTGRGMLLGTPPYMSPEQLRGEVTSHRSDLFSLSVLLQEFLTGKHPFAGSGAQTIHEAILHSAPAPLTNVDSAAAIPPAITQLLTAALTKLPGCRPASAQEFVRAFRAGQEGALVPARTHALAVATPLILLLAVVGVVLFEWLWNAEPVLVDLSVVPSVAVFPCEMDSVQPATSFLATGIPDSVISRLTRVPGLSVVPAENLVGLERRLLGTEAVAQALNAQLIVNCRMRALEARVEVSANIYNAQQRRIVWASVLDGEISAAALLELRATLVSAIVNQTRLPATIGDEPDGIPDSVGTEEFLRFLQARDLYGRYERASNLEAMRILEDVVSVSGDFADARVALAQAYYQMLSKVWDTSPRWLDLSEEQARVALDIDPNSADAHAVLGFVLLSQRHTDRALKQFQRALEISPYHADAGIFLAGTLSMTGKREEARRRIDEQIARHPDYFKAYLVKAQLESGERNYEAAAQAYEKVIFLVPNFLRAYTRYARVLNLAGETAKAQAVLHQAEGLLGDALSEYKEVGDTYKELGDAEGSERVLRLGVARADAMVPEARDFDAYRYLAWMSAKLRDASRAQSALETMATMFPDSDLTWIYVAQIQALLGDRAASLASLKKARQIDRSLMGWARGVSEFRPYRDDPEFAAVFSGDEG